MEIQRTVHVVTVATLYYIVAAATPRFLRRSLIVLHRRRLRIATRNYRGNVYLFIYLCLYICIYLFIYLFTYLFIYLNGFSPFLFLYTHRW